MKNWKMITYLLPAVVVLLCAGVSLKSYVKPDFFVEEASGEETLEQQQEEEVSSEMPKDTSKPKIVVNSNKKVKLPAISEQTTEDIVIETVEKITDTGGYKNGIYYGTGTGFDGEITVKVTIKNEKISGITLVKSADGQSYIQAASSLVGQIIKKQNTNVDVVSGATYSSKGLIEAVTNALKKAKKTKKQSSKGMKKTSSSTTQTKKDKTNNEDKIPSGTYPYQDGVYYGTGKGYRDDITVAVCISENTIQYIMVTQASDDAAFLTKAKSILTTVVKKQSVDVDVVSGATYSSQGIIEAIHNALEEAKKSTVNESISPSSTQSPVTTTVPEASGDSETTQVPETIEVAASVETPVNLLYTNGTYSGTAICSPNIYADFDTYTLSLKISVDNDCITSVTDATGFGALYDSGNDWYIKRALDGTGKYPGLVGQIVSKGTYEGVDVVSGATCSSYAIIEAVKNALESAKQ